MDKSATPGFEGFFRNDWHAMTPDKFTEVGRWMVCAALQKSGGEGGIRILKKL